jgi:hypothetical protein
MELSRSWSGWHLYLINSVIVLKRGSIELNKVTTGIINDSMELLRSEWILEKDTGCIALKMERL